MSVFVPLEYIVQLVYPCVLVQVAKIYISVYSDPHGKTVAMRGLSRLEG